MNEYWIAFLGSIIGGIISGGLTCLGVVLTIKHENKKRSEEAKQRIFDSRPELEMVSRETSHLPVKTHMFFNLLDSAVARIDSVSDFGKEVIYKENTDDTKNIRVSYKLKNAGKTSIERIVICSKRPAYFTLLPILRSSKIKKDNAPWNGVSLEKHISTNSEIDVSFYSNSDDIRHYNRVFIYLEDSNKRVWYQDFCIWDGNIKSSHRSKKEFIDLFTSQDGSLTAIDLIDPTNE